MIIRKQNILMITTGPPSLNPRLVKEADVLIEAGFDVQVIYLYWNAWGEKINVELLKSKKWKAIRVGGDPVNEKFNYNLSRAIHKVSKIAFHKTGIEIVANGAIARGSYHLMLAAKKVKADFYIGHTIGVLPALVTATDLHKKKCGFDAEDFHRNEVSNDPSHPDSKVKKFIEDRFFNKLSYLTAASPLIAEQYRKLYPKLNVSSILNVFPKRGIPFCQSSNDKLKLFWFSQTVGINRGLEDIIQAIGLLEDTAIELHLLGYASLSTKEQLLALADKAGFHRNNLFFYDPIDSDSIIYFTSQFDIGLATETGVPFNRDICLTNKIFTYIQSGLAVLASDTQSQQQLLETYKNLGIIYKRGNIKQIASILRMYNNDRTFLNNQKLASYQSGQNKLNWDFESEKFIKVVESALK